MLTVGSLFSGIGGLDLGLERAGMHVVWQAETDTYASAVLRRHWPDVPNHGDVRSIRAGSAERVDVVCGGFPCQDISVAGAGAGLEGERSGLWREFDRIVGDLRPRYALVENVGALTARGLAVVLGDLAALGYDAEWHVVPAAAVDAPHLRERCFIIAHDTSDAASGGQRIDGAHVDERGALASADADGCDEGRRQFAERQPDRRDAEPSGYGAQGSIADTDIDGVRDHQQRSARGRDDLCNSGHAVAVHDGASRSDPDPHSGRCEGGGLAQHGAERRASGCEPDGLGARGWRLGASAADAPSIGGKGHRPDRQQIAFAPSLARLLGRDDAGAFWREWTALAPIRRVDDGVPRGMDRHRLRCLGNAVLPQVAEIFGRAIVEHASARQ